MQTRTKQILDPGKQNIPAAVRIGVTGHRILADEPLMRSKVQGILVHLDEILRHTPHTYVVITSLAEGADRLVAHEVLDWPAPGGIEKPGLDVILPFPQDEYMKDFQTPASRAEFRSLLDFARTRHVLTASQSRDSAYEQSGRSVVRHCDLLVAIWDGKVAAGQGGTAEVVDFSRKVGRSIFWINSITGELTIEKHQDCSLDALEYLDTYNRERLPNGDSDKAASAQYATLAAQAEKCGLPIELLEPLHNNLLPRHVRASLLASRYQDLYAKTGSTIYILAAVAVAIVTFQVLFFSNIPQLLWAEVMVMASILLLLIGSSVGDWHRKWVDYRFLAERLRAALFLSVAGIDFKPEPAGTPGLSYHSNDWMVPAFMSIWAKQPLKGIRYVAPFEPLKQFLLAAWIQDQTDWYVKKGKRHQRWHTRLERAGELIFGLTLIAAGIHAAEIGHTFSIASVPLPSLLAFLAIVLPAGGTAIAGIRIHREYLRNAERYAYMVRALSNIKEQIETCQEMNALTDLVEQANEVMLRENQDWRVSFLLQKLQAP